MNKILTSFGYIKQGFGYRKATLNNTHWCTLFNETCIHLYAYVTVDKEMEFVYNTGILNGITENDLVYLLTLFNKQHV